MLQIQGRLERRADSRMKESTMFEEKWGTAGQVSAGVAEHDVSLKTNLVTNEKNNKIEWSKWW
jgi:hypothetical protein